MPSISFFYGIVKNSETGWIVRQVKPNDDFTLDVTFADGKRRVFDVKPIIKRGGVFAKLGEPSYFLKAHVGRGTVIWDDVLDIAPETLYGI